MQSELSLVASILEDFHISPAQTTPPRLFLEDTCEQDIEYKIRQFFIDNGGAATSTMLFSYCSQANISKRDFETIIKLLARRERTVSPRGLWILHNGPADNKVPLLKLPNELLCSIAAYLKPRATIQNYEGYKHLDRIGTRDVTFAVQKYARDIRNLQTLALVCRKLTPIAQNSLYHSVSLPQTRVRTTPDGCVRSSLSLFLRTLGDRPDLAASVTGLAIRAWSTLNIENVNTTGSVRVSPPTLIPSYIPSRVVVRHSQIPKNDEKQDGTPKSYRECFENATTIINRLPLTWEEKTVGNGCGPYTADDGVRIDYCIIAQSTISRPQLQRGKHKLLESTSSHDASQDTGVGFRAQQNRPTRHEEFRKARFRLLGSRSILPRIQSSTSYKASSNKL